MKAIRALWWWVCELARELSDENAYRRFLAARGTEASAAQWRVFSERRHEARFRRAKCC